MKITPVGIKISQRTVPAICIHFESNIMFFHSFSELSVERFQVRNRFIPVNSDKIAVPHYVKQVGSSSCINRIKVLFKQPVYAFPFIKLRSDIHRFLTQIMNGTNNIIKRKNLQVRKYFFFFPREKINFETYFNFYTFYCTLKGFEVIYIRRYV